jgi:hypothetical protein
VAIPPFEAWLARIGFAVGIGFLFWFLSTQITDDIIDLKRRFRRWRQRRGKGDIEEVVKDG